MSKKKEKKEKDLESLIHKLESLLDTEIQTLPVNLGLLSPDKRVDFISKTLPIVIKYRETHNTDGDWDLVPDWE